MDELEKLFAEASASVKRVTKQPASEKKEEPRPEPPQQQPVWEGEETLDFSVGGPEDDLDLPVPAAPPPPAPAAPPPRAAAPASAGGAVQVTGGTRTDSGFTTTEGNTIAWSGLGGVVLGRVEGRQILAFRHGGTVFYFVDNQVNYKGLLARLEFTATANWQALVQELSERSGSTGDPGVLAVTGTGGLIPKYNDRDELFGKI